MDPSAARVVIVAAFGWHATILGPLASRFREWRDVDVVSTDDVAAGWRPPSEPDLVVVCDAGWVSPLRDVFASAVFLHVGHGLISKNQTAYHYREPDFICVASDRIAERLAARGHVPRRGFLATGLIQTDPLFRAATMARPRRRRARQHTVVYAPTWNDSLTSAPMFGERLVQRVRGGNEGIRLVIKPHPHIRVVRPEWMEMWSTMAREQPNVDVVDPDADLVPVLVGADAMVSDASSAVFHFLALNRPLVLVNNPARFHDTDAFDPDGIEWRWRDVAEQVDDVAEVHGAVSRALANPAEREPQRLRRRVELFGDLVDGRSCERVHSAAVRILRERP